MVLGLSFSRFFGNPPAPSVIRTYGETDPACLGGHMANTALVSTFAALTVFGEKVAEVLGLDFTVDDVHTMEPLRGDGQDPQLVLAFYKKGAMNRRARVGERFSILVIAYPKQTGLTFAADGDLELGDGEGFEARQPWHAAVCDELAALIQGEHPREAARLRTVALDLHTPRTETGFEELFAPPESAEFGR